MEYETEVKLRPTFHLSVIGDCILTVFLVFARLGEFLVGPDIGEWHRLMSF